MGKKRKGSNKRGDKVLAGLKDAVSDEETGVVGEEGVLGEVDRWERSEDAAVLSKVKFRGKRQQEEGPEEMFALSGKKTFDMVMFVKTFIIYTNVILWT